MLMTKQCHGFVQRKHKMSMLIQHSHSARSREISSRAYPACNTS